MLSLFTCGARQLGLHLETEQVERFERYYQLLAEVGQRTDLTADLTYEQVQRRHFLESAALAVALRKEGALPTGARCSLIDVGAGAGLPGVPIKILVPELSLTLLEATAKKSAFLRRVLEALRLPDACVVTGRAEEVVHAAPHREAYQVAVSRAVAPLPALLELTLPFLQIGGLLAAPKGSRVDEEVARSGRALAEVGGLLEALRPLTVPYAAHPQTVVLVRKTSPTPARYPRRPGVPKKHPLQ
jgi:16S rRNA (guanine527-N7)-methyltransferase